MMMNGDTTSMTNNDAIFFADGLRFYANDKRHSKITRSLLNQSAEVITALVEGYKSYQRPTGHWKVSPLTSTDTLATCSHCGDSFYYRIDGICQAHLSLYCPLGSTIMIDWGDGEIEYRRADDRGDAVRGDHIDLAVPTHKEALELGVDYATVYWCEEGGLK